MVLTKSPDYDDELKAANKKKNGHPFMYPESTFMTLASIRSYCRLSYRVLEGITEASLGDELAPHFTQIRSRIRDIKVSIKDSVIWVRGKKGFALNIAPDGTGMSPSARSEYIRHRHRHKTRHGFIRAVMVVNTDTRKILSISVTSEETGETVHFERPVCDALENAGVDVSARRKADKKSDEK